MNADDKSSARKPNSLLGNLWALVSPTTARSEPRQLTQAELNDWLIKKISQATELPVDQIGIDTTFADFGLNSISAVSISTELESLLGRELSPTLIWDYPTIREVSQYLSQSAAEHA